MRWWHAYTAVLALVVLLGGAITFKSPNAISVNLQGESTQHVAADRATLALRVLCEGTKQAKVAACIQRETEAIMTLLRPLTRPPERATEAQASRVASFAPPIATLAVDAFSVDSWPRQRLLGDETVYQSAVTIKAEFRAMKAEVNGTAGEADNNAAHTVVSDAPFHYLSLVLPSLARQPATRIEWLRWFLAPETQAARESQGRRAAMANMRRKLDDYTTAMGLRWPAMHCRRFQESQKFAPYDVRLEDFDRAVRAPRAVPSRRGCNMFVDHDELIDLGYAVEENRAEAFGMEPKSISIDNKVDADWIVVDRGPMGVLLDYLI